MKTQCSKSLRSAGFCVALALWIQTGCSLSSSAHNVEGVRNLQTGNSQAALLNFQRALAANPNDADAYYNMASVYHQMARQQQDQNIYRQAEGLYHQCLDRSPDHVECHRALAVLLAQTNRTKSAFTLLERWVARSPHVADARIELARLHEEFGDKQKATRYLTEALNVAPRSARAWKALGNIREQQGRLAQALSNYQQAYLLNRNQPDLSGRIARLQQDITLNPVR